MGLDPKGARVMKLGIKTASTDDLVSILQAFRATETAILGIYNQPVIGEYAGYILSDEMDRCYRLMEVVTDELRSRPEYTTTQERDRAMNALAMYVSDLGDGPESVAELVASEMAKPVRETLMVAS